MDIDSICEKILSNLTVKQKTQLLCGADFWNSKGFDEQDVRPLRFCDGPNGLRFVLKTNAPFSKKTVAATLFPSGSAYACSFDDDLSRRIGMAIAEEAREQGVDVLLGPAMNIKRSALGGRNFEYYSEDPCLTGRLASAYISGVQSQGIAACPKHFALNNQETARMVVDSEVDERALYEIYLKAFEFCIKNSKPYSIMSSYNKVLGTYASENKRLLTDILRDEFGFDGAVVSDWGAVNDPVESRKAGLDLEMPGYMLSHSRLLYSAYKKGEISIEEIDRRAENVIKLALRTSQKPEYTCDFDAHNDLALEAALKSAVLLKNNENILPLKNSENIAVIGCLAKEPSVQGGGSSKVCPVRTDSFLNSLDENSINYTYSEGYYSDDSEIDYKILNSAVSAAVGKNAVIVFVGIPDGYESEGYDRQTLLLPENQNRLIEEIASVNSNTIVVIQAGGPVLMPWLSMVSGVIMQYYAGQCSGEALKRIIFGEYNPSGRLAETFPISADDIPSRRYFANNLQQAQYRESIFVGYRYYSTCGVKTLFDFGFGLSYSNFQYKNLKVSENFVSLDVTNLSDVDGEETVQLYINKPDSAVPSPKYQLRDYKKVFIPASETVSIVFERDDSWFEFYNVLSSKYETEGGTYNICVGSSVGKILLSGSIKVASTLTTAPNYRAAAPIYLKLSDITPLTVPQMEFEALLSHPINKTIKNEKVTAETTLSELPPNKFCDWFYNICTKKAQKKFSKDENLGAMADRMLLHMPLRAFIMGTAGLLSGKVLDFTILMLNSGNFRGLFKELSYRFKNFMFEEITKGDNDEKI